MVSGQPALPCAPGDWLVHYTYDALGRLIRKQTPIRDDTTSEQLAVRTERYFYDGARRIQEVVTDPIVIGDPGEPGGGEIPIEEEMLEPGSGGTGGGSGGTGGSGGGGGVLINSPYVDREYVYVPSGASGYVDEFICQIDRYQDLWYILQDVNYNVIALTDSGGDVVRQHTFDPYGEILTAEDFDTHPGIKVGHQGLFFDRLEPPAPAVGLISMSAAVQLQPGVFGLYQARNRVLLPRYGRWAQKDPNASGMLHASLWHDGEAPMPEFAAGSLQGVTTDGSNLFAFVGNSPFNATDPTGLFSFPMIMPSFTVFDIYANYNSEVMSSGAEAMGHASEMISEYALNQLVEFDIALDWSAPDALLGGMTANDSIVQADPTVTLASPLMSAMGGIGGVTTTVGKVAGGALKLGKTATKALRAKAIADCAVMQGVKFTKAGKALTKHAKIVGGPARDTGKGAAYCIQKFGGEAGVNEVATRLVQRYLAKGVWTQSSKGYHIKIGSTYGVSIDNKGRFIGFLTGEFH